MTSRLIWAERWLEHSITMAELAQNERNPELRESLQYLADAYRNLAAINLSSWKYSQNSEIDNE